MLSCTVRGVPSQVALSSATKAEVAGALSLAAR